MIQINDGAANIVKAALIGAVDDESLGNLVRVLARLDEQATESGRDVFLTWDPYPKTIGFYTAEPGSPDAHLCGVVTQNPSDRTWGVHT